MRRRAGGGGVCLGVSVETRGARRGNGAAVYFVFDNEHGIHVTIAVAVRAARRLSRPLIGRPWYDRRALRESELGLQARSKLRAPQRDVVCLTSINA